MAVSPFALPKKRLLGQFLPEYIICNIYQDLLLRPPSKSEILYWTPFFKKNGIIEFINKIQLSEEKIAINAKVESQKMLFMHIYKTAGTSFSTFFKRFTNNICYKYSEMDITLPHCYPLIIGHFGFKYLKTVSCTHSFTILRDPIERIISLYRYGRSSVSGFAINDPMRLLGFSKWILTDNPEVTSLIDSYYVRIITDDIAEPFENRVADSFQLALERYLSFSAVGDQSNLEPFCKRVSSLLDIPHILLPFDNDSSFHARSVASYPSRPKLNQKIRDRLNQLTYYDYKIYNRFRC